MYIFDIDIQSENTSGRIHLDEQSQILPPTFPVHTTGANAGTRFPGNLT